MDRSTIYSLEMTRSYDFLMGERFAMIAIGRAVADILGEEGPLFKGFTVTAQSPATMTVNYTAGTVYNLAEIDTLSWGALGNDTNEILQQGYRGSGTQLLNTSGLSAGQSKIALIQVAFEQVDEIPSNDPNGGVLPYVNVGDPSQPFQGPNNNGGSQETVRLGYANVTVKYGTPATSGSETAPTPDTGNAPVAYITLTFGQTTVVTGNITAATDAPLIAGLLNAHHGGVPGQAPKINLSAGAEVSGILPFANCFASNSAPSGVTGIVTAAPKLPVMYLVNANPNGALAGALQDVAFDTILGVYWICTTAGTSGTAVWGSVGMSGTSSYVTVFPFTVAPGNLTYLCNTTGACVAQLLTGALMGASSVWLKNVGTGTLVITPATGEKIEQQAANATLTLMPGQSVRLSARSGYGHYITG